MVFVGDIGSDSLRVRVLPRRLKFQLLSRRFSGTGTGWRQRDALNVRPVIPSRSGFATTATRWFRFLIVCQKALRVKHDQLVLFPPSASAAELARPPADGVSQSCCGKVAKIAQYQISHFITANAIFTGDCDSRLPPSPTKGHLRLPFWPSFCAKSRLCPLSLLIYALPPRPPSIPQRNFWACFIAFGVAKKARERERERERERQRKTSQGKEGRQNGFFPHALSLSLSRLLLLPVKQLLMICRQMVSGRRTFPPLALLQTGGWECRSKTFALSALK